MASFRALFIVTADNSPSHKYALFVRLCREEKAQTYVKRIYRQQRNLVHQGVGVKRGVAKAGWNLGAISGCAGADGKPSGLHPIKIVSQCREQARRMYYGAFLEAKKEIPAKAILGSRVAPTFDICSELIGLNAE